MISYDSDDRSYRTLYPSNEEMQAWWRRISHVRRDLKRDEPLQPYAVSNGKRDNRRRT
ncbi:MAG: hypothetical protein NZ772_17195 [Cyanobacteria bacterium]|nr:hypothetical protein [Cyanobacteriota bacterium]MDW8202842.1 hypothetical protein [Cyanobacteriota bacterium SKYGB_h_bin112]